MNKTANANSALLSYIDALLFEESAGAIVPDIDLRVVPAPRVENIDKREEPVPDQETDSDPNLLKLLLFKAAGIPLAISHTVIETVAAVSRDGLDGVVAKDGYIAWEFKHGGRMIHVIEARTVVLPNGHPGREIDGAQGQVRIIVFKDRPYGLLCDEVAETVAVRRQDIDWRPQRSTRLWLAGMVKGHNHALLDEAEIVNIVDRVRS